MLGTSFSFDLIYRKVKKYWDIYYGFIIPVKKNLLLLRRIEMVFKDLDLKIKIWIPWRFGFLWRLQYSYTKLIFCFNLMEEVQDSYKILFL